MGNKELYKEICSRKTDIPLFLQPWWLDSVCPVWDAAIAHKGEQVAGIWPYPVEQKAGVSLIRTPMLTPYLGPHIFLPADVKGSNEDSFEYETVTTLIEQLPAAKVWHLAMQPGLRQAGIFSQKKLELTVKQTFLIDLQPNEDILLKNMKENMRRNIRGAKDITITNEPGLIGTLYQYQQQTLSKKGKGLFYTQAQLHNTFQTALNNNSCALWAARNNGEIAALVWHAWDDTHSYYLMGSQNPAADNYKAMPALLWHAIKEAKAKGHKTFDLEGSMDKGVERFFMGFGGRRELYMVLRKNESLLWKIKEKVRG